MRHGLRFALTLAIAIFVSAGSSAQTPAKVTLAYKAKAGQVVRYKTEATLNMEAGGQKFTLELKQTEKVTFTDVSASGNITMERETESEEMSVNGMKMPSGDRKEKTTMVIRPDGTLVSLKYTGEPDQAKFQGRLFYTSNPVFQAKEVGVGDKWSVEIKADSDLGTHNGKAEYEVLGFEKSGNVDTVKIKLDYRESESSPVLSSSATLWIETTSGDTVRGEFQVDNVPFGPEGMQAMASGKFVQERTEGSPVGAVAARGNGKTETKPEPKKEKNIDETVKDYEKLAGLFTVYRKTDAGRTTYYMEIKEDQLDKLMLMQVTASTGTSDRVVAGDPINDILFKFTRSGDDRILFTVPNIGFKASDNKPISRAVRRSFADAILEAFKIEAKQADRKSLLINISDLFRGDIAQISALFAGGSSILGTATGGGYTLDRDKTYVASFKMFEKNFVVETAYHFTRGGSRSLAEQIGGSTLADPRSVPFKVNYNVFMLPDMQAEGAYRPRYYDPRVGYFTTSYQSFDDDSKDDVKRLFIYRWDLRKKDPKAALSEPAEPIVFWLDNAIPEEYRDAVREGLLRWNKAFERVGIKNAIVVKQMPDDADWDHADMRYNVIRWVASPDAGYAVALFRVNPLTGQILNASITVDANITRYLKLERKYVVSPAAFFEEPDPKALSIDPRRCNMAKEAMENAYFGHLAMTMLAPAGVKVEEKAYINAFISDVVSHEMGHIVGLRHNFIASTQHTLEQLKDQRLIEQEGISASVMDYNPFNIAALRQNGVDFWTPTIGTYDMWAVKYGYSFLDAKTPEEELPYLKQIASECNKPGHAYQSDEIADRFDPLVTRSDLGRDPLAYWNRMFQVCGALMKSLSQRLPERGDSYWRFTMNFNMLLNQCARAAAIASRYIGGLHVNRNHRGDPGEKPTLVPVSAADQKRALHLLNVYVFSENAFNFPRDYYLKLTDNPNRDLMEAFLSSGQDFPIFDQISSIQRAALRRLFSPAVLNRIVNNEFKVGAEKALTVPTLFRSVGLTVWSELEGRRNIRTLRRQLQRAHLDNLINIVVTGGGVPDDAKMMAWDQLRSLRRRIAAAQRSGKYDEYTRIHLDESLMKINRALDARQMIGNAPVQTPSLLQLLLGSSEQK